jgi:hypothetical protein
MCFAQAERGEGGGGPASRRQSPGPTLRTSHDRRGPKAGEFALTPGIQPVGHRSHAEGPLPRPSEEAARPNNGKAREPLRPPKGVSGPSCLVSGLPAYLDAVPCVRETVDCGLRLSPGRVYPQRRERPAGATDLLRRPRWRGRATSRQMPKASEVVENVVTRPQTYGV